ncbi:hypothetical protein [Myxococcus sp. AS-1-15]|uniref:hypothetical protein n=1 Tax=Myxococcus sp. AS-1-15 TaxID=2874600 RepID=UPI001CBAFD79|nr:hypothetical protein [Myxococcus sp. AS-1-15]MBZ4395135.1 hypothetical protein [Myxococcus sp. AS-1-15]
MSAAVDLKNGMRAPRATRPPRRIVAAPPAGAFGAVAWLHLTSRQRDVFARPRTLMVLVELVRERPRSGCVVCWRDMSNTLAGADELACARKDNPDASTSYCAAFVGACRNEGQRRIEDAQARGVADMEASHG